MGYLKGKSTLMIYEEVYKLMKKKATPKTQLVLLESAFGTDGIVSPYRDVVHTMTFRCG